MVVKKLLVHLKPTNPNIPKKLEQKKLHIKNQLLKLNEGTWNFHSQLVQELDML
jgi:hypothetical protein